MRDSTATGGHSLSLLRDQRGQVSVEYTLVLAAFGLPMVTAFAWLLGVLAEHYRMVTFIETLPFP